MTVVNENLSSKFGAFEQKLGCIFCNSVKIDYLALAKVMFNVEAFTDCSFPVTLGLGVGQLGCFAVSICFAKIHDTGIRYEPEPSVSAASL